jgi:hypothetical protein
VCLITACSSGASVDTTTTTPSTSSTSSSVVTTVLTTSTTSTSTTSTVPTTTTLPTTTTTTAARPTTTAPRVTTTAPKTASADSSGYTATIHDVDAARLAHSWTSDCPVSVSDVVLIELVHWGFDGKVHDGAIVVARSQGKAVAEIFRRLYEIRYPIQSVIPIGDLPVGIEDSDPNYNNTSGLHCRRAVGSTRWSEHAKGLAIDINTLQNPFVTSNTLWPANSGKYRDRSLGEPGMILSGDAVVDAFADKGWLWGGYWDSIKDYQHFSVSGR